MERIYNFSAGPAVLPQEVLVQAQDEMLNWQGCGMSVMEMSHRGKEFMGILYTAEHDLRDLLQRIVRGEPVRPASTRAVGCYIPRVK